MLDDFNASVGGKSGFAQLRRSCVNSERNVVLFRKYEVFGVLEVADDKAGQVSGHFNALLEVHENPVLSLFFALQNG